MINCGTRFLALAASGLCAVAVVSPACATDYVGTVIASGLNNPRGLAIGADGALYIAEGGTFNPGGPITTVENADAAYGTSGSITRIDLATSAQTRPVTGLPSLTGVASGSASGPQDIAFYNGTGYVVIGLGADPAVRTDVAELGTAPGAANLASLYSFTPGGSFTKVADLGNFEASENPAGDEIDSNPYHLTAGPNGLLVTDAGGNSLLNVTSVGDITTVATFAAQAGVDAVPTGVSIGPDGAFYVGQLTGVPFTPGAAEVFRIDQTTGDKTVFAGGLTNVTDIAWGADGFLYVLQFIDAGIFNSPGPGSIRRINADGTNTLIYGGLVAPTGLEIGADGSFYVTNFSPAPGRGEVLRISAAVPEPATWAMMIGGFGLAGAMMRRRRTAIRFA